MKKSDFLATQFVGFCPLGIRNSGEYLLAILDCTGNIALAGKHGHPCFLVAILKFACVHHEPGKIILCVDTHGLATFNKAVVESRYLRTGLGYVEQPVAAITQRIDEYRTYGRLLSDNTNPASRHHNQPEDAIPTNTTSS